MQREEEGVGLSTWPRDNEGGPGTGPAHGLVTPDLVRVTEAAALACSRGLGRGDQERAREIAGTAMRHELDQLAIAGRVMLAARVEEVLPHGATVGRSQDQRLDLGVYPVEGATLVARGAAGAISMLVAAGRDRFPVLPAVCYLEKIVAGPVARGAIDLESPLADNLRRIAFAGDARISDLRVAVLDRPRHHELVEEIREAGARVVLLEEGEIAGALLAAGAEGDIDAMVGIGGLEETLMAACAVRCLGGEVQARLWPRNDEERALAEPDLGRIYTLSDLAPEEVEVAVTGISGGPLLRPVAHTGHGADLESLTMSGSRRTVRRIRTWQRYADRRPQA
jgi:fructose-1,6-bisphosphatase II